MLAAIGTWLASQGASIILGFVAGLIKDWYATRQADQAQRDAGAAETASTLNKETADAEHRASDAAINAPRGASLDDDLDAGRRGF